MNDSLSENHAPPRIHLLCNAHIDPVWQWEWEEGVAEALSTFRTAADLCETFEGFVFNHNEVIIYQWVEEYEPALFARIQRLVREGKWHSMGGWYLQPDCNMPSGESLVRQILVGRHYFEEKFGVRPTTALNFDPFGHTRGLVQILAKSGYDSYLFCRPQEQWCHLPDDDFIWVGYDGSEVLAHRSMTWYTAPLGGARDKIETWMQEHPQRDLSLLLWGVGDHGGGPSRKDLRDLAALIAETDGFDILHSTPEAYFAELRDLHPDSKSTDPQGRPDSQSRQDLPRHAHDINPWAVGCYTSQIRIKQQHRALENALYAAEKMASTAALQRLIDYPKRDLDAAQRALLFSEFHDILPGSSIQPVEETSLRLLHHGLELLSRVRARAFFALAQGQPRAVEGRIPILVYNPHPFPVHATVQCEFQLADINWSDAYTQVVATRNGKPLPTQVEHELGNVNTDWRKRVIFNAELSPSRINRFDCRLDLLPQKPARALSAQDGAIHHVTHDLDVVVNTTTGLIDRFCVRGVDTLAPGAFTALVIRDNEDPWETVGRSFRDVEGRFEIMTPADSARFAGVRAQTLPPVRIIEDGEVRTVVEALFGYGRSALCMRYNLPKQGTEIELSLRVLWNEKDRMLKLSLPTTLPQADYMGQVAYGAAPLPANGDEAVAQKWVAVVDKDKEYALTCINNGTYGSDYCDGELRLSLLRSPSYAGYPILDRPIVPQDRFTPRIDQGERLYRFWLNAGPLGERLAAVDREALVKNELPFALSFFPQGGGSRPEPGLLLSDNVVQLTAFKQAEDGRGFVIRLFEPTGQPRRTTLSVPSHDLAVDIELGSFEIKTLRLDPDAGTVTDADLLT
ncbi:MAG: alpha-mannosidase [Anaerolineae bacterium]|nr:alpha-mannosidase [Anaerolineae bacterium]